MLHIYFTFDSRKIKWFFQRVFRGWSDADLWCLDYHLARYIYPRLKAFIKSRRMGFYDNGGKWTSQHWEEILRKMLKSFKWLLDEKPEDKTIQEGFELFGKHFMSLWD
jgi:hypothetical protein